MLNIGFAVRSSGGGGGRDGRQWYEQCGGEGGIAVAKTPPMRSEVTVSETQTACQKAETHAGDFKLGLRGFVGP